MNQKSNLLLLVLFAITVCVVGWLGFKLASQQDQQIKVNQIIQSEQALTLFQNNINSYISSLQNRYSKFAGIETNDIQEMLDNDPMLHEVLMFDAVDELIFPAQISLQQQKSSYQWLNNMPQITESKMFDQAESGWFVWYDQQKEKYIYWSINPSRKLFMVFNNAMFMADFIHWLAQQPNLANQAFLLINDNQDRIFYQWGDDSMINSDINIQKHLSAPLTGWSLRYYANTQSLSSLSKKLFQGGVIALLVLVSIITYILFQMKRREQTEAQQRLSFINQVSHELKTPLTNIRLHGDLLERTLNLTDTQNKTSQSITIIQQESERLTRLINNVLNFNSVNKNSLRLVSKPIAFSELIQQSIQPFKPAFDQLNINITIENHIEDQVCVDADIVKQIIGNLLSNIEKYASTSNEVEIKATRLHENLIITIQDQGEGVNKKFQDKVFDPFYRVSSDLTHASGSGLGLGLARELAQLHGGDLILLTSESGAKFQLSIQEFHA